MIVKTRIMNPTDQKQRYSWIPKHGAFIAAKGEMIIDGDVYTLAEKIVKNRNCIDVDIAEGRVRIAMITDMDVQRPKKAKKVLAPKVIKKEKKVNPKPKAMSRKKLADLSRKPVTKEALEDYNILGEGIQEGSIEEAKPAAFDPFTGDEKEDGRPKAESVSDYLWGADNETVNEAVKVEEAAPEEEIESEEEEKTYTKLMLKKMLKTKVIEIADELGCIDMPETKALIIEWILDNQ